MMDGHRCCLWQSRHVQPLHAPWDEHPLFTLGSDPLFALLIAGTDGHEKCTDRFSSRRSLTGMPCISPSFTHSALDIRPKQTAHAVPR